MAHFSDLDYAFAIMNALDRPDDVFDTGLSLDEREALADAISRHITRRMSEDIITVEGMQLAREIKQQYLAAWALTLSERGERSWVDTGNPVGRMVLPYRTVLIASSLL
jgi:hypothetical protein